MDALWEHHGVPGCYGECLTSRHHWNTPRLPACVAGSFYQDRQHCLWRRAFRSKPNNKAIQQRNFLPASTSEMNPELNVPSDALSAKTDQQGHYKQERMAGARIAMAVWSYPAEVTLQSQSWARRVRSGCLCCIASSSLLLPKVKSWSEHQGVILYRKGVLCSQGACPWPS